MRKRRLLGLVAASAALSGGLVAVTAAPANASGSTIDIGYTIQSGNYVKGSGSDNNTGDYSNVCVAIWSQQYSGASWVVQSSSCRSNRGSNWWSAPDVPVDLTVTQTKCWNFKTRITATFVGGTAKTWKDSNTIRVCNLAT
jgi:hypothetical protein